MTIYFFLLKICHSNRASSLDCDKESEERLEKNAGVCLLVLFVLFLF